MTNNIKLYCACDLRYKEIAANWALHLEDKNIHDYEVICTDKDSLEFIKERGLNAIFYKVSSLDISSRKFSAPESGELYNGFKLKILKHLLAQKTSFIFSDADAVVLKDPRPCISPYLSNGFFVVSRGLQKGPFYKKFGFAICSGWMAVGLGAERGWLLRHINSFLKESGQPLIGGYKVNCDQEYFNHLFLEQEAEVVKDGDTATHFSAKFSNIAVMSNALISRGRKKDSSLVVHPWSSNTKETITRLKLDDLWIL